MRAKSGRADGKNRKLWVIKPAAEKSETDDPNSDSHHITASIATRSGVVLVEGRLHLVLSTDKQPWNPVRAIQRVSKVHKLHPVDQQLGEQNYHNWRSGTMRGPKVATWAEPGWLQHSFNQVQHLPAAKQWAVNPN